MWFKYDGKKFVELFGIYESLPPPIIAVVGGV
jgi:hypothetical protein